MKYTNIAAVLQALYDLLIPLERPDANTAPLLADVRGLDENTKLADYLKQSPYLSSQQGQGALEIEVVDENPGDVCVQATFPVLRTNYQLIVVLQAWTDGDEESRLSVRDIWLGTGMGLEPEYRLYQGDEETTMVSQNDVLSQSPSSGPGQVEYALRLLLTSVPLPKMARKQFGFFLAGLEFTVN